ncbi:MAG: NAD(P)-dependent alcohol dehydrogenase, partial [Nodosilinea sp.]
LCAQHNISPKIKMVGIDEINDVFDSLASGSNSDFRHVIDMETLRNHSAIGSENLTTIPSPDRGAVVG